MVKALYALKNDQLQIKGRIGYIYTTPLENVKNWAYFFQVVSARLQIIDINDRGLFPLKLRIKFVSPSSCSK